MSNAVRIPITAIDLNGDENGNGRMCSYVRRYFEAHGLGVGDTWIAHEYMAWIGRRHDEYKQRIGCPCYMGYNNKQTAEFDAYLQGFAAEAGEGESHE